MTYLLFIANKNYSSWSMRPWVLLRALGIPFEEKLVPFEDGASTQREFFKFSPTGRVPCLHDTSAASEGDEPLAVLDSLAIVEYIAEREPRAGVWPSDVRARAFARSACAEMHSSFAAVRDVLCMNVGVRVELGEPGDALKRDLARLDALWTEGLERFGGPWLAGDRFTAADAFYVPVATRLRTYGVDWLSGEAMAYVERLLELPATKEWVEAGLKETFRERGHEDDCLKGKKLLADYRATA